MRKLYASLLLVMGLFLTSSTLFAQGVKGKITDAASGQPLPGVSISVEGRNTTGASTDASGQYTLRLAPGSYRLKVTYIGYTTATIPVTVSGNETTTADVSLKESATALEAVAVVGSRAATARTNVDSAVPVDVITPKELKGFSQVDVSQILNFVAPSFNANRQTVADGTDHIDPASLRGLGPDQVLVLVNGKRRHNTALVNINGTVGRGSVGTDMNVIPVAAIDRIEVLRDGAAAQYGSDAIAGVINIVLKKDYEGFNASVTTGQNFTTMKYNAPVITGGNREYKQNITDGGVFQVDFSKGFRLGENGFLTVSGQYNNHEATNRSGLDNVPTTYLGANGGFPGTPAGQDVNTFRANLIAADAAIEKNNGYNRQNMVFGNSSARNLGLFVNGSGELEDGTQVYFAGGATNRIGQGFGNYRIPVSRGQQPLRGDGTLFYRDGFLPGIESEITDLSLIAGVKGKIGEWNADFSNTFGNNRFNFNVFNSGNASLPNSDAQQTRFDAGTLYFSQNTINFDVSRLYESLSDFKAVNLAFGAEYRIDSYSITAGEINSFFGDGRTVPGAPLANGGAPQGTAVALPGAQVFPGFRFSDQTNRSRSNLGVYADIEGEVANRVLLGVAGRFEDYSDFGSNFSWKASTRIKLTDDIAIRGSISTGFRAPSLQQRYFQNTSTQFVSGLPSNTLTVNNDNSIARDVVGVDPLRPETSNSLTVGLTGKLGNYSFTIDAYKIDIADRIVYSGAFSRAVLGFGANEYLGINNVNFFANAANTTTKGIDVVATARYVLGKDRLIVTAALNFNQNEVTGINSTKLINDPTKNDPAQNPDTWFKNRLFDRQQRSRIEVWQPNSKVNLSATYSTGKWDFTARAVRFGEVKYVHNVDTQAKRADGTFWNTAFLRDNAGNAFIDQTFSPVTITDIIVGYKINKELNLSVGANNVFDVYPDQIYIDPRNAYGSVDFNAGRDASNRGRLLFQPNQGGYNGRHIFARLVFSMK
jgi:iron complex outermembrane recepter protein